MEHQAATFCPVTADLSRYLGDYEAAERAAEITDARRADRKHEILADADQLFEACTEYADPDAILLASLRNNLGLENSLSELLYAAAEKMAADEVKPLTVDELRRERDEARAEMRREEALEMSL